ncbi:MAG: hypothetical protein LC800_02705 [Acidobacteria bacterium]|nr:hypothetical protein [Acidobacteriota bacterium]
MSGFVGAGNRTRFDEVLDSIGDHMPGCLLFKFGQAGETPPQNPAQLMSPARFVSELHNPAFYNLTYNPDDRLVEFLAAEEQPVRSVLITDGVYSQAEGGTTPPVVNAMQKWMQRGRSLGIFVFRSRFSGRFYSEVQRGMLPRPVTVESRPFYAFVFSPTVQGIKELQERLEPRFREMRAYIFSPEAIDTIIDWEQRPGELSLSARPPAKPYYWQMFNERLFARREPPALTYTLRSTLAQTYPAAAFRTDTVTEYHRWARTDFKKEESLPGGFALTVVPQTAATGAGGTEGAAPLAPSGDVQFTLRLSPDRGSDFGFYHVRLNLGLSDLRPEILALSTRDDRNAVDADKTYRFYEFMYALTNMHFKTQLAGKSSKSLFVTVQNH